VATADVYSLLRARNPVLWIVSRDESRVERYLFGAAAAAGYTSYTWDVAAGVADLSGNPVPIGGPDPAETLDAIRDRARQPAGTRCVWILRDLPAWLDGPIGAPVRRRLRNLARQLPGTPRERAQAIIVLSSSVDIPADLSSHATLIEWPLPDRGEVGGILDATLAQLPDDLQLNAVPNGQRAAAIDAAVGLTAEEVQATFARSLVQIRRIDPALVAREKRRLIAREKLIDWCEPLPGGLDAVGGLDNLKTWLVGRGMAFTSAARAYGLPAPRGALLLGIPGCGKSLSAKAIATAWKIPLLRLDLNALKSKFVGESEGNLRRAFRVIEVIGRCVVWLDEVEKALAGATQSAADGGVSSDALGAIHSWMQERRGEAFVICTANDVQGLPPELLRKGRFDEIWFVDVPTLPERIEIIEAALRSHGRDPAAIAGLDKVAAAAGFTGAELAALVPDALFVAFADGARPITAADLLAAATTVVPLTKTAAEKIGKLREWARGRARPATSNNTEIDAPSQARALDL
jgi:hypothetical protein